jgi:hypothetical protein
MEAEKLLEKLLYIECYLRVMLSQEAKKETLYFSFQKVVKNNYTEEEYRKDLKKALAEINQKDGVIESVTPCSKTEFETKIENNEERPFGYITFYLRINCEKDDEEKIGFAKANYDFSKFKLKEAYDIFATGTRDIYEKAGYTNIYISSTSKEDYEINDNHTSFLQ